VLSVHSILQFETGHSMGKGTIDRRRMYHQPSPCASQLFGQRFSTDRVRSEQTVMRDLSCVTGNRPPFS
jgi:hypothetical protein